MARNADIMVVRWIGAESDGSDRFEYFTSVGAIYERYSAEQLCMGKQSMLNAIHRLRTRDLPVDFSPRSNPHVRITKCPLYGRTKQE